jgi:hypothetical protein
MKLEDQFCLFRQAKKLKEFGVDWESLFVWSQLKESSPRLEPNWRPVSRASHYYEALTIYPAYTSSELGLMLPDDCRTYRLDDRWQSYYPREGVMSMHLPYTTENLMEASAKASLLLFLLENKFITIADINSRLYLTL